MYHRGNWLAAADGLTALKSPLMFYGFLKDISNEFSYMVLGAGLIAASSLPVIDASLSENRNQSLAAVITEKKEHHGREDEIRRGHRQSSRREQFSLKAHFQYQVTVPLLLMLTDAVWRRWRPEWFAVLLCCSSSRFFSIFWFRLSIEYSVVLLHYWYSSSSFTKIV